MRNVVKNRFPGSLNGDWELILKAGLEFPEKGDWQTIADLKQNESILLDLF
jgi:hypothetical protein